MLLYEYQVRDELARFRSLAVEMLERFTSGDTPEQLESRRGLLKLAYDHLDRVLPREVSRAGISRHLSFAEYYLVGRGKGTPERAKGDIHDIVNIDIPAVEAAFREWCGSKAHYDETLATALRPLLAEQHLDSAIRKAFVILKERLVRTYRLPADLDGRNLVNQIFGQKGYAAGRISDEERESMRNLLDGLFGVFRNLYQHNDVSPEWYEAEAVLSTVNWVLKRIATYPPSKA